MFRSPKKPAKSKNMTRRSVILLMAQLGFVGALGLRMRQLQVKEAERFLLLAEENRINIRFLPPARGLIFDRNGKQLAVNKQIYRITMVREQAKDPEAVLKKLATLIDLSPERQAKVLKEMNETAAFVQVSVAEFLSYEDVARVSANSPALPGISAEVGQTRHYPKGSDMAHVVGYVGPVSDYDLKKRNDKDPLLQIPKFQIGKTGVERRSDLNLRGEAGISRIEVNSVGRVMRELDKTKARPGENLQLTVDNDLQNYALRRIEGQSASAVVMDVYNGDIMALASAPSFDPNKFVLGISTQDWNGLLENKYRPLSNKAASGAYPPGSTFKMVVVLAALEEGLITPSEKIYCPGHYLLGEQRYHCWSRGGHGDINLRDGLKKSCDVYYYDVARRVGIEKITEMARRLGLGYKHDLPLPAVTAGLTPTKGWKRRKYDKAWLIGDTLNAGIGQGYMLASPLHLATMTARLASGLEVVPRLIRATGNRPLPDPAMTSMGLSENSLGLVRRAMYSVVNEKRGTAYSNRIVDPRYTMAGKTGTSQVRRITKEERAKGVYRNEDLPWERRDHALFVAYAPYDAPRYAISVVVEHGGAGSKYAAPIARDILLQALHGGTPPLSAYPKAQRNKIRAQRDQMPPAPPDIPFNVSERA